MSYPTLIIVAVCAYLIGSIPFGYILVRLFQGIDVRSIGSGNTGATNVARTGGKRLAIATLVLDIFKGWLTVFLILTLPFIHSSGPVQLHALATFAALIAVIGHMFPLWLGFKGGKGVATGFGVFLVAAPWAALAAIGTFCVVIAITRFVALGSMIGAASFPVYAMFMVSGYRSPFFLAVQFAVALLIIIKHHSNIGRLLEGTEDKVGAKSQQ